MKANQPLMKTLLSALIVLTSLGVASGQTFNDVLRYSFFSPQGSARFAGTGGSLTPMGVDPTTLHTNPAGIGWNRYNMVQVTPGFSLTSTGSSLVGSADASDLSEAAASFTLPSAGAVFAGTTRSVNWSTLNFGISLTRLADLNQQLRFDGRTPGSLIEKFAEDLNDGVLDEYGSLLADPYVIPDSDPNVSTVYTDFTNFDTGGTLDGPIQRNGLYDRRGSINELAFGLGGNYREKVLWGFSLGIPFLRYEEAYTYEEVDDQQVIPGFENLAYTQNLNNNGQGVNLKFGLTAMPTERIRVSGAIHTPTFWSIDEQYSTTFDYFYNTNGTGEGGRELSPLGDYSYNLRTPWRYMLGAGVLVGTRGFLSVDADYADYTGNSASFDDFATANDALNSDISTQLASSIAVRAGGELNVDPLQVRAGVGYRQVPYAEYFNNEDRAVLTYSGGLGYSVGKFFVDLAAQVENYGSFQLPYQTFAISGQTVTTDRTRVSVLLSVGLRGFGSGF